MCAYHYRDNSLSEANFKCGDRARLRSVEPLSAFLAHPFLDLYANQAHEILQVSKGTANALILSPQKIRTSPFAS
jgi:hypothetical protein